MKTTKIMTTGVIALGAMFILAGCKEDYSNPRKFIDKYVIQDCANKIWTPEFLAERKLRGPIVSDVKLGQEDSFAGPLTVVSANLRFEFIDKDAVYVEGPIFPARIPYAMGEVKKAKDVEKDVLEASVSIARSKMDDGVFAPVGKVGRDIIQGWGTVHTLELASSAKCEAGLVQLMRQYGKESDCATFINYAKCYISNGQLEYINNKDILQLFAEMIVRSCAILGNGSRFTSRSTKEDIAAMPKLFEMLKAKGVNVQSGDGVKTVLQDRVANGRKLFCGVIQANIEREAVGLDSVWPKTAKTASSDKEDISGMVFKNATAYFNTLFDMANKNNGEWEPYVSGLEPDCAFCEGKSMWNVAAGVKDEMEDIVPVFISANFDCRNLPKKSYDGKRDADKLIPIGTCPVLGNSGIVVIYKGGAATYFTADNVTLGNIFRKQAVREMPEYYLAP